MYSKLPIHGNSLLEQYELCPHRLRVRVVTTYHRREPPVRLQNITHLERLGDKPVYNKSKFCIWSDMDLNRNAAAPDETNKIKIPPMEETTRKPTVWQKMKTKAQKNELQSKESVIWLMKPTKPLYVSQTNIYEYIKANLGAPYVLKNHDDLVECPNKKDINSPSKATQAKNHVKNFKLKRTLSKTTLENKNSKQAFRKNDLINSVLKKPCVDQVDNYKNMRPETTVTEIIGFENIHKERRQLAGADKLNNRALQYNNNLKFFPIYSSSSNSQISADEASPKFKKATTQRAGNKTNLMGVSRNAEIKNKINSQKLLDQIKGTQQKMQVKVATFNKPKEVNNATAKKINPILTNTNNPKKIDNPKKYQPCQNMKSVMSSQGNEDLFKEISKTTTPSSPFSTSESYNTCISTLSKNLKQGCQISFHTPVAFKMASTDLKSPQQKVSRNKSQKRK